MSTEKTDKPTSETPTPNETPYLLTTEEVADILRMSPRTVQKFAKENRIPTVQVGRKLRFHRAKLLEWIDSRVSAA